MMVTSDQVQDLRCNMINENIRHLDIDDVIKDHAYYEVDKYLTAMEGRPLPNSHKVLAAAFVYIASVISKGDRLTQNAVGDLMGTTSVSIRSAYLHIAATNDIQISID